MSLLLKAWWKRPGSAAVPQTAAPVPVSVTRQQVFTEGDPLYDAMLTDIAAAATAVRFETYIFSDDEIGGLFLTAFSDAARRGVRVEVRFDHAGSWFGIGAAALNALRESGVKFQWSRRWDWRRPFRIQRRNHRKLLIVDDRVAYLGGFNAHRVCSRRCVGDSRWRDTHISLGGAIVGDAIEAFDRYGRAKRHWRPTERADFYLLPSRSRVCRVYLHRTLNERFRIAQARVWLTTPYFVPDLRTQTRLVRAARRGVDVRILVPGKSDVPLAQWAARAAYSRLLREGIRIFEYQPRVLHAKTALVDDDWATVGTANIDFRSFYLNDEINLIAIGAQLNARLVADFEADLAESHEVKIKPWKRRPWTALVAESIGWWARKWL